MSEVLKNRGVNAELALKYCADIEQYGAKLDDANLYLSNGQYSEAQKYFEKVRRYVKDETESEDYYNLMSCASCFLK